MWLRELIVLLIGMSSLLAVEDVGEGKGAPAQFQYMLRGYAIVGTHAPDKEALGGFYASNKRPKSVDQRVSTQRKGFFLQLEEDHKPLFAAQYQSIGLLVVNKSDQQRFLSAQDSRISLIQQAKTADGVWKNIEYLPSSWCGNSYHRVILGADQYWSITAPRYDGPIKTEIRFKLAINGEQTLYSASYQGGIHEEQFSVKQGHKARGIMDPYTE